MVKSTICTKQYDDKLNPGLEYTAVILDNWQNTCTRGVIGDRILWITRVSYD